MDAHPKELLADSGLALSAFVNLMDGSGELKAPRLQDIIWE